MDDFLLTRPAPYVIGLLLGFCVVGVLATLNQQLGALGGYSAVYERVTRRTPGLGWKASGTALGSPASFVATGTFMGVAIAGTFLIDWVIV